MNTRRMLVMAIAVTLVCAGCQTLAPVSPPTGVSAGPPGAPTGAAATASATQQETILPAPAADNLDEPAQKVATASRPATQTVLAETPTRAQPAQGEGVKLLFSRQAMKGADSLAKEFSGVTEEIYFSSAHDIDLDFICSAPQSIEPPLIGYDFFAQTVSSCMVGFPENEPVWIELYAPDGSLVRTMQYTEPGNAWSFTIDEYYQSYGLTVYSGPAFEQAAATPDLDFLSSTPDWTTKVWRDINIRFLRLWTPVGLPEGVWRMVASASGLTREIALTIPAEEESGQISILSSLTIDPFEDPRMLEFAGGDTLHVAGQGFAGNLQIPIGIYYETNEYVQDQGYLYTKVFGTLVETSEKGDFIFTYQVDPDAADGTYVVLPDIEEMDFFPSDSALRFTVNTGIGTAPPGFISP